MRRPVPVVLLIIAACSSTSSQPGEGLPGRSQTAAVRDAGGGVLRINPGDDAARSSIAAPLETVWKSLPAAFDSLGIPVNAVDPAIKAFGNSGFELSRRLGGTSLSQYIDCGQTQAFPSADTYQIYLVVMVQLHPADAQTTSVATSVQASGKPMTVRGDYTRCSSRGVLEKRVADRIRAEATR
ncbi:MAG TPA: hypothetical protein VFZ21_19090 [Gemmatimonadaceae bacterium]|jgi:hypothetical protein|nr:hypothetical protein [Gemmatimonadaceae bacterium]